MRDLHRFQPHVSAETILHVVADYHGVSVEDLAGPCRSRTLVSARQQTCWLLRERSDLSYSDIGRLLGGRDHTSIIAAVQVAGNRMAEDAGARLEMGRLRDIVDAIATRRDPDNLLLHIDSGTVVLVAEILRIRHRGVERDYALATGAIVSAVRNLRCDRRAARA